MTTELTLIEAGTLTASLEDRTVTGLLLPWEEVGNSNLGKFAIAKDAVKLPRDPSIVTLNMEHDRTKPVGRATALTATDAGIVATFKVADTDEGDEYLLAVEEGRLKRLSAEVSGIVIRAGKAIAGALFGAAAVAAGAFPSAALMASDQGDPEGLSEHFSPDEMASLRALLEALKTTSPAPAEEATTGANASPITQEMEAGTVDNETTTAAVGDVTATIPGTLNAGASTKAKTRNTMSQVTSALAMFHRNGDTSGIQSLSETNSGDTLFAALGQVPGSGVAGSFVRR